MNCCIRSPMANSSLKDVGIPDREWPSSLSAHEMAFMNSQLSKYLEKLWWYTKNYSCESYMYAKIPLSALNRGRVPVWCVCSHAAGPRSAVCSSAGAQEKQCLQGMTVLQGRAGPGGTEVRSWKELGGELVFGCIIRLTWGLVEPSCTTFPKVLTLVDTKSCFQELNLWLLLCTIFRYFYCPGRIFVLTALFANKNKEILSNV